MQNILSSDSRSLIASLLFLGMGIATIILDLRNWRKERRQGLQHVWFQRIMTLTGVLLIITGLMVFTFINLVPFGSPLSSVLSLVFLLVVVALGIYAFLIIIRSTIRLSTPPQEIHVGRIDAEQVPLAANPLLLRAQIILIGGTFLLLTVMLLGIVQLFSLVTGHHLFFWGWALLIVMPFLAFWLLGMSRRLRTLQRIERLRFSLTTERRIETASLSGSPAFFAPFSITLRIKRIHIAVFAVLLFGLMIRDTVNPLVSFLQSDSSLGSSTIFFFLLLLVFGMALFTVCFLPFFIVRTTVEAKENGLRMETGTFLHWHEARLFACYMLPDFLAGDRTTVVYELSSSRRVITWRWLHDPKSPLTFWKPLLPLDEYHRQMQALCDLVIEKTGLSLHDLTPRSEEEEANSK